MTNLEIVLESLKIIPSRYNRLAACMNMPVAKLIKYVVGEIEVTDKIADIIADGIYAFIGKKVEPKSLMEEKIK